MSWSRRGSSSGKRYRFGEALAMHGDDALDERFPGEAVLVDVANEVPARVAFSEPDGLPAAIDAGGPARLFEEPLFDRAGGVAAGGHPRIQSLRSGGRPSVAARAR